MAAAPGSRHFRLQLQHSTLAPGPRPALLPPVPRFSPSLRPCQLPRVPAATKGRGKGKRREGRGREPGTGAGEGKGGARGTGRVSESPQQQQHRPDASPRHLHRAPTATAASRALPGSPTNFITLPATYPTSRRQPPIAAERSTRPANHGRGRRRCRGRGGRWREEVWLRRAAAAVQHRYSRTSLRQRLPAVPRTASAPAQVTEPLHGGRSAPPRPRAVQPSQSSGARGLPCELQARSQKGTLIYISVYIYVFIYIC